MEEFYPFFLVIFAAVFFSTVFRRLLHFPWVIALIVGGIIIGPHGFDIFQPNQTIEFFAQIGLVFLMFMAGLETKLSSFNSYKKDIATTALLNGGVPFFVGISIGYYLGFNSTSSILLGIIFISSSIAIIIPSLTSNGVFKTRLGKITIASTIVADIASLVLLSFLLQTINPTTLLPLPLFYVLLFGSLIILRKVLPLLEKLFASGKKSAEDLFQQELRSVFAILVGTIIIFEFLGLHSIIAGFFAGLVLSGSVQSTALKEKLRTIGYGIFIPVFFVVIGTRTDISVFNEAQGILALTLLVVAGSIGSKFISGWVAGRLANFTSKESAMLGASTIPQLSTTLAVVFVGVELGILEKDVITAVIILSIATVFLSPLLVSFFSGLPKKTT